MDDSLPALHRRSLSFADRLGQSLLTAWVIWWGVNLGALRMLGGSWNTTPAWSALGLDFWHCFLGVRHWFAGGNPYLQEIGDPRGHFSYPPIALGLFAWTRYYPLEAAIRLWTCAVGLMMVMACGCCYRFRKIQKLSFVPVTLLWSLVLWSSPTGFAMERGGADVWVLVFVCGAALALEQKRHWSLEITAGILLALGGWLKIYPLFILPGLLALDAWLAFSAALLALAATALISWSYTMDFFHTFSGSQAYRASVFSQLLSWWHAPGSLEHQPIATLPLGYAAHSLTSYWPQAWDALGIERMVGFPGILGVGLILMPGAGWLGWKLYKTPARRQLALPWLLWLATVATFWMPMSFDYNLIFLPMGFLCLWDRSDSRLLQGIAIASLIWCMPLSPPGLRFEGFLLALKCATLLGFTLNLWRWTRKLQAVVSDKPIAVG